MQLLKAETLIIIKLNLIFTCIHYVAKIPQNCIRCVICVQHLGSYEIKPRIFII